MSTSVSGLLRRAHVTTGEALPLPPELARLLRRAAARLRLDRALAWGLRGLAAGLVAALLLAAVARLRPLLLPEEAAVWCGLLAAAGLLAGAIAGLAWSAPQRTVAIRADLALGLKERISTALELRNLPAGGDLVEAQLRDAISAVGAVGRLPRLGPAIDRRLLGAIALLALVTTAALWLPNPQSDRVRERRADAAQVEAARAEVETIAAGVAARTDLDPAVQDAMLSRLDALADALEPGELTAEEAEAELAAAESELRRLEDAAAPAQAQALHEAAPMLQTSGATAEIGNALATGDLAAAAEAMNQLGEEAQQLSPEEQQALADRLNELAAQLQPTNPELAAALAAAAASLASGDPAAAAASLSQAAAAIAAVASSLATNDAAASTAASLAQTRTDLAEGSLSTSRSGNSTPGSGGNGTAGASGTPSAGNSGPSGPGSSSAGATPVAGDGSGSGQGSQGQGTGAGAPSGNGLIGGTNAQTGEGIASGNSQPRQGEAGTEGTREEEPIYAPVERTGGIGEDDFLAGQETDGNSETGMQSGTGLATDASVPYSAVYGDYAEQASRDLEQGEVPVPLQPYVRDYFSALDPAADDDEEEES